jgi:hypothetical protein
MNVHDGDVHTFGFFRAGEEILKHPVLNNTLGAYNYLKKPYFQGIILKGF